MGVLLYVIRVVRDGRMEKDAEATDTLTPRGLQTPHHITLADVTLGSQNEKTVLRYFRS